MFYACIVSIRESTFSPWCMEGGVGVFARYGDKVSVYFMGLQLSGPGAMMGAFSSREGSGLPKKLRERIVVERIDDWGRCFIERNGVWLIKVAVKIGEYNDSSLRFPQEVCAPGKPVTTDGACLLHRRRIGEDRFCDMELIRYDSPPRFNSWEKTTATLKLCSTPDDSWGEVPLVKVLGAGWMVSDNWVRGLSTLYKYPDGQEIKTIQYLFADRYDLCAICSSHQRYE